MSQINLYIPADLEKQVRLMAKKEGQSLSAFVAGLFRKKTEKRGWHPHFFSKIVGGWCGTFREIPRDLPENRDEW